jgi:DNA/RNA endonuclease YhcR with UshA esterase domain
MKKTLFIFFLFVTSFSWAQAPFFRIDQIRGSDTTGGGCSDMDSMDVTTTGIVHGVNIGASNTRIQLSLIDKSIDTLMNSKSGIGLFKADQNLPVSLNEGDSISVVGLVTCFNGLSQIVIQSVQLHANNRPLVNTREVLFLTESTESMLVKIRNLEFLPSSWPASPSGSGFTAKAFRGIQGTTDYIEFDIRIDNDCDLFGSPMPTGKVDIVGLGGQFDSSIPRDSRYQLSPRRSTDITPAAPLTGPSIKFSQTSVTVEESNSIQQITVEISNTSPEQISVIVEAVDSTTDASDYSLQLPHLVTFPANTNTVQVFSFNVLTDSLNETDEYFSLRLRKLPGTYTIGTDSIYRIKIAGTPVSVKDLDYYQITPNPITDLSVVKFRNVKLESMRVVDSKGNMVFYFTRNIEEEMKNIKNLSTGIYKVIFTTGNKNITRTIIKQ